LIADTMTYTPSAPNLFTDGQVVPVELVRADDLAGHPLRGTYAWNFNVDLTPPIIENTDPIEGQLTEDKNQDIVFNLTDTRRRTDSTSVLITVNDTRSFTFGDAGFAWDASSQTARFIPENASPALTYANDESICVTITCADIPPDYGAPNPMDEYRLCFLFAITTCDIRPLVATPNGDGVNDGFIFEYPRMLFGTGIIHIYDLSGEEIWTSPHGATTWDCKAGTGSIVRPGLYLYSIENDGEVVCNGTLSIIR